MASETMAGAVVKLRLLGRFVVVRDGAKVTAAAFGGRKVRALLRMLAVQRGRLVPSTFWPKGSGPTGPRPIRRPTSRCSSTAYAGRWAGQTSSSGAGGYELTDAPWCVVDTE